MIIFTGTCPPSTTSCRPSRRGGRPAGATPRPGNYLQYLPIYVYLSISKSKSILSIYLSTYVCICRPDTADTAATPPTLSPAPAPLPWQMVQPPARMFLEEVRIL